MNMQWKNLFKQYILDRGYDYYLNGAVENIDVSENLIKADVIGTEDYEVVISLDDAEVTDMYCSCPYASGDNNCKHMAAVLFEWEELQHGFNTDHETQEEILFGFSDTIEVYKKKQQTIQDLVDNADVEIVKDILKDILMEERKWLLRFTDMTKSGEEEKNIDGHKRQVDDIVWNYSARDGFISYYEADNFIYELQDVVNNDVRRMISNQDYINAFDLSNYIFKVLGEVDMDDSAGGGGMLAEDISFIWREIISKANDKDKRILFNKLINNLDGSIIDYMEDYVEDIIMEEFRASEYLGDKIDFVKVKIERAENDSSGWSRDYNLGKWVERYLKLEEEKAADDKEIEKICNKYWKLSKVRNYYIDRCMKLKKYELALKALNDSIFIDRDLRGLVDEYCKKKKEIYLIKGDRSSYLQQLWNMATTYCKGNLAVYRELKSQYEKDVWQRQREKIFSGISEPHTLAALYKEDKLYERLLDVVLAQPGIYLTQRYSNELKKLYPEQVLLKYKDEINKLAVHSGPRSKYQELVKLLREMERIEGGLVMVENILSDWRVRYKSRPAMMDELNRL